MDSILIEIKNRLKNSDSFVDVNWPKDISEETNKGFIWVVLESEEKRYLESVRKKQI